MTDCALWEVILNGDSPQLIRFIKSVEIPYPPTTIEEKLARRNELKARGTLLMALPIEHQLKFNSNKNAKSLIEAIKKRFRGNKESKKVHKTLLKQQYENFNGTSSEGLDQIYDRLQKLTSQLEIHRETISEEDLNMKLLRINTAHGVSAANSKTNASNLPNVDSLSDAVIYSFFASQSNSPQLDNEDLKQINPDDLEEIDFPLRKIPLWGKVVDCNVDYEIQKILTKNKKESRRCRATKHQDNKNKEAPRRTVLVKDTTSNALVFQCDGLGYDWSDQAEDGPTNFALMAYTSSSSSSSDTEVFDSEDEDEIETESNQIKPSFANVKFVKPTEHVKSPRKSIKKEENNRQTNYPRKNSQSPRVLFKVPRQNNMYSFNLKNVAPLGGLTYLFSKATIDESNLWHRRLGHNRVLVVKPHNKTTYDRLLGRSPNIDFMKPFGYPVTILNTLDHLGKFERKADEGFLVGYYVNRQAGQEKAYDHEYILLPFMPSSTQSSDDKDANKVPGRGEEGSEIDDQAMTISSTQDVNTAGLSINTANTNINIGSLNINTVGPNDQSMPSLEETNIFDDVYDDREVGAEADINNLDISTVFSLIPTTRVHKDHPKEQIIVKTSSTLIETHKALLKDKEAQDAMKEIFRYLKGQAKLGLWYPRDSPFNLEAFSDSDFAGASLNRKSTTRVLDFCKVKTVNDDVRMQALVDGKNVVVNEAYIRCDLRLNDAEGTACLLNAAIFEELARMGNRFLWEITPLVATMMVQAPEEVREIPTDAQDTPTLTQPSSSQAQRKHKPRSKQREETEVPQEEPPTEKHILTPSYDPLPSAKKTNQAAKIEKLKKRVKKLEGKKKKRTRRLRRLYKVGLSARIVSLDEKGLDDQEDASKQERSITDIDQDEGNTLVNDTHGKINEEDLFGVHNLSGDEVFVDVTTGENIEQDAIVVKKEISTADPVTTDGEVVTAAEDVEVAAATILQLSKDELTLTHTLMEIKAAKPKAKEVTIQEPSEFRTTSSLQPLQPLQAKDKGKGIMVEPEKPLKMKDQIALDEEVARKLEAEMKAKMEEEDRIAREKEEANIAMIAEWDNTQAMMDADYKLAVKLQEEERGELTI
nr:hypothetical protein [Tanacetum cinerariifolium]